MNQPMAHVAFLQGVQELSTNDSVGSALTGSATYNGKSWDCGPFAGANADAGFNAPPNAGRAAPAYFRAFAASDQSGTLNVQQSPDGTNWFKTDTTSVTAGFTSGVYLESKVCMRYVRCQLVNGSSAQTDVELDSVLVSI